MAQLDVYENLSEDTRGEVPFLLDLQHELHRYLRTHIVVPLVRLEAQRLILDALCPQIVIDGHAVFASVPEMSAYPVSELGDKVGNLEMRRREVFLAVDFLLNGF